MELPAFELLYSLEGPPGNYGACMTSGELDAEGRDVCHTGADGGAWSEAGFYYTSAAVGDKAKFSFTWCNQGCDFPSPYYYIECDSVPGDCVHHKVRNTYRTDQEWSFNAVTWGDSVGAHWEI